MANSICSLKSCKIKKSEKVSLFSISKNEHVRTRWLSFLIKNGNENVRSDATYRLCENHFRKNSISEVNGKKLLQPGTCPSDIFIRAVSFFKP